MKHVVNEKGETPLIFQKNTIFLIFESELQAEIFNSRCHDSGEVNKNINIMIIKFIYVYNLEYN